MKGEDQDNLRGRIMALAVDFGTRARDTQASVEKLVESGHDIDAGEIAASSKTWADASGALWSMLGTQPMLQADNALVRIGLTDLAGLLARDEQNTRRVRELEARLAERTTKAETPTALRDTSTESGLPDASLAGLRCPACGSRSIHAASPDVVAALGHPLACDECRAVFSEPGSYANRQDILSLYIAGGSTERLTVGQPWIDRAIREGARITYDWTRADGYDQTRPSDELLRKNAEVDVLAVLSAGLFWQLAPKTMSEGASSELGVALAWAMATRRHTTGPRARIVVSGPYARRNLFALLADEIYDTHEEAWEAIRERVTGGAR